MVFIEPVELDEILAAKREELAERKRQTPLEAVRALASMQKRPLPILNTVTNDGQVLLIGQIKHAAVDENSAAPAYDPVAQAVRYARNGVDAIALFTDSSIYNAGLDDLMFVARAVRIPVLSQDYIFEEYQVVEARAAGAAGLLLSAAVVDQPTLRLLVSATQRNRMTSMVEVRSDEELVYTLSLSPQVIVLGTPRGGDPVAALRRWRTHIPPHIHTMIGVEFATLEQIMALATLKVDAVLLSDPLLKDSAVVSRLRAAFNQPETRLE